MDFNGNLKLVTSLETYSFNLTLPVLSLGSGTEVAVKSNCWGCLRPQGWANHVALSGPNPLTFQGSP